MSEAKRRAKYTLEYKMEPVRLVKGGQAVSVTAKILGIPKASLGNWGRLSTKGQLKGAGDKPVSPEQDGARHPKKSDGVLCKGVSVKYAWIASNKARWPITLACDVLGVSASGYFERLRRKALDKHTGPGTSNRMSDERLLVEIRIIHAEVKQEYGWSRMWKELVARGHRVDKERVRRLMKKHGVYARSKCKFVITSDSKHHLPIAPDLLQRNFTPTAPNQVWTGDIT